MNWNKVHHTPVANLTTAIYLGGIGYAMTMDASDLMICIPLLLLSLIPLIPIVTLIRSICLRFDMKNWPRRTIMLIPVVATVLWIVPTDHRQGRVFLKHGMAGDLPKKMEIHDYTGNSGLFVDYCWMGITCEPNSLRNILNTEKFAIADQPGIRREETDYTKGLEDFVSTEKEDWIHFVRCDKRRGPRSCVITTDKSFEWARVSYSAGD